MTFHRILRRTPIVLLWVGLLAAGAVPAQGQGLPIHPALNLAPVAPSLEQPICEFCNLDVPPMQLGRFHSVLAEEMAGQISDWNLATIARADSLRAAGAFGPPAEKSSGREAARYLKFHALTSMDFISYLSEQEEIAWESNEREIGPFYRHYANPGIYPVWGLQRVLLGGGAFCMEFRIASKLDDRRMLGIRPVRLRADKVKVGDDKRRAWSLEMETSEDGKAHYLFCDRYAGRMRQTLIEEDGESLKVIVLEDLEGFYVRKWGTHKCTGIVLWRSVVAADGRPPEDARIGGAAYFPGLKLNLPGPIPDVHLNDLRAFPGFQPLIAADIYAQAEFPEWLSVDEQGIFSEWNSEGEMPQFVRDWFPDR